MSNPLVSTHELESFLAKAKVFDIRWKLNQPGYGRASYLEGHIPGAVFVDLDSDLSGKPGSRGRHPLPPLEHFAGTLGRLGIDRSASVVVYDDVSGMVAARMWWMLVAIGHSDVRLLDGGFQRWVGENRPIELGEVTPEPVRYSLSAETLSDGFTGVVTSESLTGRLVLDVRAADRYRGVHEPVDPRPGHIPGAFNLPSSSLLADGRFRPAAELADMFRPFEDPVVSCGSGVVACHSALAMTAAGLPLPDVYVGSYSEWSNSDRPVVTGESP